MSTLSPTEAAKRSGVSRRSIMRAIASGALDARRDNRNQWQIDAEALAQWAPSEQSPPLAQHLPNPVHELQARIAGLEELVKRADARADAAEVDRDAWRDQAQRLALAPPPSQGLLKRLFGRKVA